MRTTASRQRSIGQTARVDDRKRRVVRACRVTTVEETAARKCRAICRITHAPVLVIRNGQK